MNTWLLAAKPVSMGLPRFQQLNGENTVACYALVSSMKDGIGCLISFAIYYL